MLNCIGSSISIIFQSLSVSLNSICDKQKQYLATPLSYRNPPVEWIPTTVRSTCVKSPHHQPDTPCPPPPPPLPSFKGHLVWVLNILRSILREGLTTIKAPRPIFGVTSHKNLTQNSQQSEIHCYTKQLNYLPPICLEVNFAVPSSSIILLITILLCSLSILKQTKKSIPGGR